ncbi:ATP-binding protein [Desulforegula conservatrix]|uniref:ATP-binding protein n=1 Tax=Desulforegula conservatrix TaxID=153026 RepID=UPI00040D9C66|nr:ATP-binding protein [Desulforegula conservatrix]
MTIDQINETHPLYANLDEIRNAANRSADLTRQLLAFARQQPIAPKPLDLNDTVEGMLKMLRRIIGEDIDLVWMPGKTLWKVNMDPSQIDQLLANLCVNARDAISGVGKMTIETENVIFDAEYCADHAGFTEGEYIMLTVGDNGCGMDKETQSQIFEPFFTTKEIGKGTGLGLATIYGIIKQNKGFINVYSEPDHGTVFTIYLPRYMDKEDLVSHDIIEEPAIYGHEVILLVEDEPILLNMTTTMLERKGYTVLAASTPEEAISLAETYSEKIQLLITDVVMPEMNGRDLAKKILSINPSLKCLFASGYTADVIAHHGVLNSGVNFIQKPFSVKALANKVRDVLDG